ncbi:MAG TPA: GNAT family N-acetyltransferase [Gemmatirosa sp.]
MTAQTAPCSAERPVRVRVATTADAAALAAFAARTFTATYARGGVGDVAASRPEDVRAYVDAHFTPARQRTELGDPAIVTVVADLAGDPGVDAGTSDAASGDASPWVGYAQLRLVPRAEAPPPAVCVGAHPRELLRFYVDHAWQGRGVADALMHAVLARARAEPGGADPIWLAVYQANARAVAFYRRHGFVVAGAGTFTMGGETQHDWLMRAG